MTTDLDKIEWLLDEINEICLVQQKDIAFSPEAGYFIRNALLRYRDSLTKTEHDDSESLIEVDRDEFLKG